MKFIVKAVQAETHNNQKVLRLSLVSSVTRKFSRNEPDRHMYHLVDDNPANREAWKAGTDHDLVPPGG